MWVCPVSTSQRAKRLACHGPVPQAWKQNLLCGLLVLLVLCGQVFGYVVGEGVRVKVDEDTKEHPQLHGGEGSRGILKDAVGHRCTGLVHLLSLDALGFVLFLLPLEFSLALLGPPSLCGLLFCFTVPSLLCVLLFALLGLFLFQLRWRVLSLVRGWRLVSPLRVHRGSGNRCRCIRSGRTYALPVDDDGCLGGGAGRGWLGVRVLDVSLDLAEEATLDGSGLLLPWTSLSVLDLHELRSGYNLPLN